MDFQAYRTPDDMQENLRHHQKKRHVSDKTPVAWASDTNQQIWLNWRHAKHLVYRQLLYTFWNKIKLCSLSYLVARKSLGTALHVNIIIILLELMENKVP